MKFSIIKAEVNELCSDTAWEPKQIVDLDLISGEILFRKQMNINHVFEYEIEIKYFEESCGEQVKIDYLEGSKDKLFLSYNLLRFFKIQLLKDKMEHKLEIKNVKEINFKI